MMGTGRSGAIFSWVLVAMGAAIVVRTISLGVGGGLGLLIGGLMILAGALRLFMASRA